jgi:hypothetical protein
MTAAFVAIHLGDPITATARRYPSERVANVLRGTLHPFLRFIKRLHTLIWAALLSLIVCSGESTLFGFFLAALGTQGRRHQDMSESFKESLSSLLAWWHTPFSLLPVLS